MEGAAGVDVNSLVRRLADRRPQRTEANVQSDLHVLLLAAPLHLADDELDDIVLEQPAGARRRIDVEVGSAVFEVKRDLRIGNVRHDAVDQLAGYVEARSEAMGRRYVGVLTDGCEWWLYRLVDDVLVETDHLILNPAEPDVGGLVVWLEAVLATGEQLVPLPAEIERKLGASSPGFALDVAELTALYASCKSMPEIVLKRQLWARLLFAAFGTNFTDDDELFVAHTYLVLVAEVVAHAVVGIDLRDSNLSAHDIVSGSRFETSGIGGVVESDFFDWPAETDAGARFVQQLAQRLARFDWSAVHHDVLKTLYESVIDETTRHRLGEYYTPDWLALQIVADVVSEPLEQRVMDPACGSGTFLFWAIRRYLEASEAAGIANANAVDAVTRHVTGIDLHPVAVTLARVTYLMAIGTERLQDRGPFVVPVYLGDSIQLAEDTSILDAGGGITIPTTADQQELFAQQIHFPSDVVADASSFDRLVTDLAYRASHRGSRNEVLPIKAVMNQAGIADEHREAVEKAYKILCSLHDARRDHVWAYYIRNLARPVWLSQVENRADCLIGNPPWLRYNAMTAAMQDNFRRLATERGLWTGAAVATSQDLAALFVARSIELYLRIGGKFGFIMPASTLSRAHYVGFRAGRWSAPASDTVVAFAEPWELSNIEPPPFPVPSCVSFGKRVEPAHQHPMEPVATWWSGKVGDHHLRWEDVALRVSHRPRSVSVDHGGSRGHYGDLMRQGSNLVPRVLVCVEPLPPPAMGLPAGQVLVRSRRIAAERAPWKDLPALEGAIESQFVRSVHLGETLMPFRFLDPILAVVPFAGGHVLEPGTFEMESHPGLADWWQRAEATWSSNKKESTKMSLAQQIDYQSKLSNQYPPAPFRVVYTGRGSRVAAAVETDITTIIDHALYWTSVETLDEARYLTAILNSDCLHELTEDFFSKGLLGPRNIHKAAFGVPIPVYDPDDGQHRAIVELAAQCEAAVAAVDPVSKTTSVNRRHYRSALAAAGLTATLDEAVVAVLPDAVAMTELAPSD